MIRGPFALRVVVVLTVLFYVPILVTEMGTLLAVEGGIMGDTLLFAAIVLLAGFGAELVDTRTADGVSWVGRQNLRL